MNNQPSTFAPAKASTPEGKIPSSVGWALGSGTVLQGFNSSVIAVALVSIALHFGSEDSIPWLVSSLYIACAVASPSAGRLADLFGPRSMFLAGLAIVAGASLAAPFAPTVGWLIADRVLLGMGASIHFPAAMVIIRQQAQEREADSRSTVATVAMCGQTMAALGPSLGGVVVLWTGWQGIFLINIPLVLLSAIWVSLIVPKDAIIGGRRSARSVVKLLDLPGLALFVIALVTTMLGLLSLPRHVNWLYFVVAVPLWALFAWREGRASGPFLDIRLLVRHPEITKTCMRSMTTFIAFYSVFYGLPQWLESSRGLSPAEVGLLMMPVFGVGVLSTLAARIVGRRVAPRVLLLIGTTSLVFAGAGMALLLDNKTPCWLMLLLSALLGVPTGFNNLGNQYILQSSAPADSAGVASGLYRTSQYIGATLATVTVALNLSAENIEGGVQTLGISIASVGITLTLLSLVAAVRSRGKASALSCRGRTESSGPQAEVGTG